VTGILVTGDFFGEGCLAGQPLRMSTAAVPGESIILRLEKKLIVRLLHEQPGFAAHFLKHLLARNIRIEEDLVDQIFNSSEKRLARRLLLLADFENQPEPDAVAGRISQETLAAMIGTTRSRVSFFMNRFRKLGFIEYKGEIKFQVYFPDRQYLDYRQRLHCHARKLHATLWNLLAGRQLRDAGNQQ
jgi:CRP-like cAMP-binding protein